MTDVRLTATNSEDSSVVPVLCNAKGELKLEEPIIVEGEKGEKGDQGEPGKDGDPFTGEFDGDVSFTGSITAAGGLTKLLADGKVNLQQRVFVARTSETDTFYSGHLNGVDTFSVNAGGNITAAGSAIFTSKNVGFNEAGELLFYSRNERYRAVAQNGNMMCEPYTREMELREKAGAWAEKNKSPETKPIQD